jgi:hypothetical protein
MLLFRDCINNYSFLAEDKFLVIAQWNMEIYSFADKLLKAPSKLFMFSHGWVGVSNNTRV